MDKGQDLIIDRVCETLRPMPTADPRAVARVLGAVLAAPRAPWWERLLDAGRIPVMSRLGASAFAVAALLLGFVSRGALDRTPESETVASSVSATGEYSVVAAAAAREDAERLMVPTQFVFEDGKASSVSLVGEFNAWEAGKTELTRLDNGIWTVTLPLSPGRHVYAFVIDGTLVKSDPRAPQAEDADFGRAGSVVMVFAP